MPQGLRAQGLFALAALVLSACATTSPRVPSSEVEVLEKVLRARSARYLIAQSLRVEAVGGCSEPCRMRTRTSAFRI